MKTSEELGMILCKIEDFYHKIEMLEKENARLRYNLEMQEKSYEAMRNYYREKIKEITEK